MADVKPLPVAGSNRMVERAARAIAFYRGSTFCGPGQHIASRELGWEGDGAHLEKYAEIHWREHISAAMGAIQAVRDLTAEDINACPMEPLPRALKYYRAMIDAALIEPNK